MVRYLFAALFLLLSSSIHTQIVSAQDWYYPMDKYKERITVKNFGTFIDSNFYKGKEKLFPHNKFYGYHAAVDLDTDKEEKNINVPVYAVHSGTIVYVGSLDGYGGVILERLQGEERTALYGHVKISNLGIEIGDEIKPGQIITYLGDEFSKETSGERKHLHFGIYKGADLYFHGHESSQLVLLKKWEDPTEYLKTKGAISPERSEKISPAIQTKHQNEVQKKQNILAKLKGLIQSLFRKMGF